MKKRTVKLRFKLILLAAFLIVAGVSIYTQQTNINTLMDKQQSLTQQYEQAQSELDRLKSKSEYVGSKQYVEDTAREKLGLAYDDELILVPEESDSK